MSRRAGRRFFTMVRGSLHVVFVTRLMIALVASTRVELNGSWRFRIDRHEEGEAQGWDTTLPPGTEVVRVPHTWNLAKYDEYEGVAGYFRSLELSPAIRGQQVELHFASTKAVSGLNGKLLETEVTLMMRFSRHFASAAASPWRFAAKRCALAVAFLIVVTFAGRNSLAQANFQASPENLKARQEFQNAKFGMFIHWGVYSVLASGEWVFHDRALTVDEYNRLPLFFDPESFDAKTWVALAKAAGMKYITITSRHHDGFAMFDSKVSDWNIVQRTPYKKDPLKILAEECHRQGIKLFFYYSQLDWHNPNYYPRGATSWDNGRPNRGDWNLYLDDYMDGQLRELLTNYGPIGGIWFDGMWDKPDADWHLAKTYALIHELQPAALIIPNHHQSPKPGEDVQTFERDLPGQNTAGFNTTSVSNQLPLESSDTLNDSWGFNIADSKYKSPAELERRLVQAAGNNSNLLLNIGPMPNGEIQPEFVTRLQAVGEWLSHYGDSIYGTRGGPIAPDEWGVTTQKDNNIYVHILSWHAPLLAIPPIANKVVEAHSMLDRSAVEFTQKSDGVVLKVPLAKSDEVDRVVVLTLAASH